MADDFDKYSLTPEQLDLFFLTDVLPRFVRGKTPSDDPKLVYLSGQPGAGKSSLSKQYSKEMGGSSKVVVFGADDIRAILPYAKEVQKEHEMDYPFYTKKDSGILRTKLMDYCMKNGISMVVESIFANENDDHMPVFKQAKDAGFGVEVAFLGVDKNLSTLGIYWRYEDQKEKTGRGFAPTLGMHDKAYDMMPKIITGMIRNPDIDTVKIFDRHLECYMEGSSQEVVSKITDKLFENHARDTTALGPAVERQTKRMFSQKAVDTLTEMAAKAQSDEELLKAIKGIKTVKEADSDIAACVSTQLEKSRNGSLIKDDHALSEFRWNEILKRMQDRGEKAEYIAEIASLRNRHMDAHNLALTSAAKQGAQAQEGAEKHGNVVPMSPQTMREAARKRQNDR